MEMESGAKSEMLISIRGSMEKNQTTCRILAIMWKIVQHQTTRFWNKAIQTKVIIYKVQHDESFLFWNRYRSRIVVLEYHTRRSKSSNTMVLQTEMAYLSNHENIARLNPPGKTSQLVDVSLAQFPNYEQQFQPPNIKYFIFKYQSSYY